MSIVQPEEPDLIVTPAPGAPKAAPRRRAVRVRVGRLCLPPALVAWGLSIAAHGALLGLGAAALRSGRQDAAPGIALARGDGGDGAAGGTSNEAGDEAGDGGFFVVSGDAITTGAAAPAMPALPSVPPVESPAPLAAVPEQNTDDDA